MAAIRPRVIVSRGGLTAVTITAQAVASDGTLSDTGTAVVVTSDFLSHNHGLVNNTKNISASTSSQANNVVVEYDTNLSIDFLFVDNNTDISPLHTLVQAYDTFKVSWVVGTQSSGKKTRTGYYSCTGIDERSSGKEEVLGTISFAQISAS